MRLPLMSVAALSLMGALALPFSTPTAAETAAALVGTYECEGVEPDGTPYKGLVQIIGSSYGMYEVVWIFASGQQYSGLGVVNGDVLAVSYFTTRPGVAAYRIEKGDGGPRLLGQWTVVGAQEIFRETLTRLTEEVKRMPRPEPLPDPAPRIRHFLRPA